MDFLRRRDRLSRDVVIVFLPVAVLFVLEVFRLAGIVLPAPVSRVTAVLVLAQPVLTLNLVGRIRDLPRPVLPVATAAWAATSLPFVVFSPPVPAAATLAAIIAFVIFEFVAAAYLAQEATRRTGSGRARLATASLATAAFGVSILVIGASTAAATGAVAAGIAARLLALSAAVGYAIAFLPPARLRGFWQANYAYGFTERLMRSAPSADAGAVWQVYAEAAREIGGAVTALVVVGEPGEDGAVVAVAGEPLPSATPTVPRADLAGMSDRAAAPSGPPAELGGWVEGVAAALGATYATVVSIHPPRERATTVLVLLTRHRRLFEIDDMALLASLGARTALVAERAQLVADEQAMAAELAHTVEALRSASEAKSDFLASMSHELRTPLSAIIGFSDLMRVEPRDGDRVAVPAEWVEHIHMGGEHLLGLINDVLDLSKVEAGRLELQPEPFDLGGALRESIAGLQPIADRKSIRLEAEVDSMPIVVDRGRLRQVMYNLVSNAIKFTPDGGTVRVAVAEDGDRYRISVTDTGVGIAPEDRDRVFEEFRQVGDPARRQAGTGLGLALTRRLVEAHGGWIELESSVGVGSTFTVVLPRDATGAEAAAGVPGIPAAGVRATAARAARASTAGDVIVIEDDPSAVRLLREYLEPHGYRLRAAADGEAGLRLAREAAPIAIILDVLLPGMDGWEVLRRLKEDPALQPIPVLIVTVVDEREVGLALGADDYFLKPVDRAALLDRLARCGVPRPTQDHRPTILAVDDDPVTLATIDQALRPEGYEVLLADGGRRGIELARAGPVDLVVLDLLMPDLDGYDVVRQLRGDERTRDIPILILTAHEMSASEKARLNGDILGVLAKGPAGLEGLRVWLGRVAPPVAPDDDGIGGGARRDDGPVPVPAEGDGG